MYLQKSVVETLQQLDCSTCAFAGIIELSPALLSLWTRGIKRISPLAESKITDGLRAIAALAQIAPAPLDWRRVPEIKEAIRKLASTEAGHAG